MKKILFTFFSILVVSAFNLTKAQVPEKNESCKEIIGYYPSWQMYKRSGAVTPEALDYSRYTILNYSFFAPDSLGYLAGTDPWADTILLRGKIDWSKPQPGYYPNTSLIDFSHLWGVKIMVSIGGWTLSDNFPRIANDPVKRARFASECNRVIKQYQFDGIDIDWEYPCYEEHSGLPEVDKKNYTLFMQQIRDSIDALGKIHNRHYLLTAAFGANPSQMDCIEYEKVSVFMDYINMMTYDFNGVWTDISAHNSPLYPPAKGYEGSLDEAFRLLMERNVPTEKINLGVAFYGRTLRGFKGADPDLHIPHEGISDQIRYPLHEGQPLYYRIVDEINDYEEKWDDVAKVPYLLNKKDSSFVSYDNEKSIKLKAEYALDKKCGGVIIWDATGDYILKRPGTLLISGTPLADQLVNVLQPCELPRIKKRY
jgi:chitinase